MKKEDKGIVISQLTETVKEYDFGYLTDRLEEILKKEVEEK